MAGAKLSITRCHRKSAASGLFVDDRPAKLGRLIEPRDHGLGDPGLWLDEIAVGEPPSNLRVHAVTFAPGARTAWHSHPLGQALHVLSGVGRVCSEGGDVRELRPGDHVWISPGERHWHGAAPDHVFVHLAVQEARPDGMEASWFEHVSEEEFTATAKPESAAT